MAIDDALAEVDRLVDAFVAREPVPGVSYGVIVDGELVSAALRRVEVPGSAVDDASERFTHFVFP